VSDARGTNHQLCGPIHWSKRLYECHNWRSLFAPRGLVGAQIARQLGLGRRTVLRYLRHEGFPERQGRSDVGRSRLLDPGGRSSWSAGTAAAAIAGACFTSCRGRVNPLSPRYSHTPTFPHLLPLRHPGTLILRHLLSRPTRTAVPQPGPRPPPSAPGSTRR
jgi:hypothetical protein